MMDFILWAGVVSIAFVLSGVGWLVIRDLHDELGQLSDEEEHQ